MKLIQLFSKSTNESDNNSTVRPKRNNLELIVDYGIKDDKFAGKDSDRAIMIVPTIAYDILEENNISLEYGSLGENLLVDCNIMDSKIGTLVKIGNIVLEITQKCTICNHLATFDKQIPSLIKDYRGVYCKIIKGGILYNTMDIINLGEQA